MASLTEIYQKLLKKVWVILLTNAVKTFLVALFVFFLFHFLITRHLLHIVEFTKSLDLSKSFTPLKLLREQKSDQEDELDELVRATNERILILKNNHDYLEECVKERTEELTASHKALIDSEMRFRSLSEAAFEGIVITERGKIIEVNDTVCKMLGYQSSELIGKAVTDFIAPEERENVNSRMLSGYEHLHELCCLRKDGSSFPIEVQAKMFSYKGQQVRVSAVRDISERKKMEKELIKSKKLEATAILAAGIAHDFNNLLTIIKGFTEMALYDLGKDHKNAKDLLQTLNASSKAQELTNKFVTFTGVTPDKRKSSIEKLLTESVNAVLSGDDFQSELSYGESLWQVEMDMGQMSQAFKNVLLNAKESMQEGGTIQVHAENISSLVGEAISGETLSEKNYVKIVITDQGEGIPEQIVQSIFDPYFSTKERGAQKGMGLGLTVAHSIIKQHDGHLVIKSEENVGTSVYIYLPAAA
ncbi:nitrogen regulation protein NR(II) [Thermodesulfobacteriota bacterium]